MIVLLDQKDWIGLAKADRAPNKADVVYVQLLEVVRSAAGDGHSFPLSGSRYYETARTSSVGQRREIAMIMQEISSYATLLHPSRCIYNEFVHFLRCRLDVAHEVVTQPIFGTGALHAFGEELPIFANPVGGPPDQVAADFLEMANLFMQERSNVEEFRILAFEADGLEPGYQSIMAELKAEEAEFERSEARVAELAHHFAAGDTAELTRLIKAETVKYFLPELVEACQGYGLDVSAVIDEVMDPEISLVDGMPGLDVLSSLRAQYFRNKTTAATRNDRYDLINLQQGAPYCDVVSVDKAWASLAARTHLTSRYGVKVVGRPSELLEALESL